MSKHRILPALAVAGAASALATGAVSASPRALFPSKTVAEASSVEYRAMVVAHQTSGGSSPTAKVTVEIDRKSNGAWKRTATHRLGGVYFWKVLSGPGGLCRFELRTTGGIASVHPGLVVQLLETPSIGCGRSQTLPLTAG